MRSQPARDTDDEAIGRRRGEAANLCNFVFYSELQSNSTEVLEVCGSLAFLGWHNYFQHLLPFVAEIILIPVSNMVLF